VEKKKAGPHSTSFSPSPLRRPTAVAREDIFSPYSQAKLNAFRKALKKDRDIWFSWKEDGVDKTSGLVGKENERQVEDEDEGVLVLPKELVGDRDHDMKPLFMKLVALIGEFFFSFLMYLFSFFLCVSFSSFAPDRSSLRGDMKHILRGSGIDYPIHARQLKKSSAMKEAYKDLRELLRAHEKCKVLKGGVLKVTPGMLEVFL